ncbi:MAG: hypothetical protein J6I62_07365 [Selenomonadaceae bacterium]|nr:hypothetical protein [Selenomonadaceae bacterium]
MKFKQIVSAILGIALFAAYFNVSEAKTIKSQGLKLDIPDNIYKLVRIETSPAPDNIFRIYELGSVEAAKKIGVNYDGAGWIFGISKISEETLMNIIKDDIPGTELFAYKDDKYYMYNHPTDVRYMREDNAAMERDQHIWTKVNEWAYKNVREKFVADNNLCPVTADEFISKIEKSAASSGDDFTGAWHERIAGRGHIDIVKYGDMYKINIMWGESAFATSFWQMTARFKNGALHYDDCEYKSIEFDGKGGEKIKRSYKNGKGEFKLLETDKLLWNDFTQNAGNGSIFLRD